MNDVFISHAAEDGAVALEIADGLEQAGYSTWCYEVDSAGGVSYLGEIDEELEHTQAVVLVISQASLQSFQVTKEIVRAHESGKPFIPVRCGVAHEQIQRKGEWRMALGAAVSVPLPDDGPSALMPRLQRSLQRLGVRATGVPGTRKVAPTLSPSASPTSFHSRPAPPGPVRPDVVPGVIRNAPLPVIVAMVVGAAGALFNLINVLQALSPSDPNVQGLYLVAPFLRVNNLLVNLAGLALNGALLFFAWRTYKGDGGARHLVNRVALALLSVIALWYLLTLFTTMTTGALAGTRGAVLGAATGAALIAGLQAGLVYVLFRERVAA